MSKGNKASSPTKRNHSRAKQVGVTHIGCPRAVFQSLNRVLREILQSTGRKIRPFDILRDYPEIFAIYERIARLIGADYGFSIDVNISVTSKRAARRIRVLANGANSGDPQLDLGFGDDTGADGSFLLKSNDPSGEASSHG
jgi:hypothetical protein